MIYETAILGIQVFFVTGYYYVYIILKFPSTERHYRKKKIELKGLYFKEYSSTNTNHRTST